MLRQEAERYVKEIDEIREATGGPTTDIYQFEGGSNACFAPDAADFLQAGEVKAENLAAAQRLGASVSLAYWKLVARSMGSPRYSVLGNCRFRLQR